ncbi:hypothetical protein Plim_3064 [Planctopirus limnophila DSM 3776]|uniref:Uncharacterized protein n=1 Tax=Planctopirus limnophila (strain ATCC 43296 / DSM 3776 / IFAM 1008 / Mu 290) TaxID=521674 RepID=D5SST2_PLAL2|nr:hypothetical protein Plim_3064 [Planctopirus limnophila DSM 3776]
MISMSDSPSHRVQNIPVIQPDAIAATILRCSLKQNQTDQSGHVARWLKPLV